MRERARDKGRLEDIIEYSTNVTNLIEGYSLNKLIADKRTYYSVMYDVASLDSDNLELKEYHAQCVALP